MSDPVQWPQTLPQEFFMGFTTGGGAATTSFQTTTGRPKARLRSTYQRRTFATPMEISGAQLEYFEDFWANINYGVDPFQWVDPTTGDAVLFVFLRKGNEVAKPDWRLVNGGPYSLRRYAGTLELEYAGDAPE